IGDFTFTDLTVTLEEDTGSIDGITSNGVVNVTGVESGATWEYRLDGGAWVTGTGSSFILNEGTYTKVEVRQTDAQGNVSEITDLGPITIDQTPPVLKILGAEDDVGSISRNLYSGATTDDNTPTLHGTVEEGITQVTVTHNGIS